MSDLFTDFFSDDAFSSLSLTAAINEVDHIPGRAGELAFAGVSSGIATTEAIIESRDQTLSLIQSTPRGAPAPKEVRDGREIRKITPTHIQLEDVIRSAQIQDVRQFGGNQLESISTAVNDRLVKMSGRMDLTLEHLRLGALKGVIADADGSTILDLYDLFGISPPDTISLSSSEGTLRNACQSISRSIERSVKLNMPGTAQVYALCGDDFFDQFVSHTDVSLAFGNWEAAQQNLAGDVRKGFTFGGIIWENYRGTDDLTGEEASEGDLVGSVGIVSSEARLFVTGVPGLFAEYYATSDFIDTANTIGLPRYARMFPDPYAKFVALHTQSNPLPLCLRPQTLRRAVFG